MNLKNFLTQNKVITLFVLIVSLLYIGEIVNPALWFHKVQPPFLVTSDFLLSYLKSPGGFSVWISNFIMQSFYIPVAGVIVFFALTIVLSRLIFVVLQQFHKSSVNYIFALFPLVLAITQASNYSFPISITISLLLTVAFLLPIFKIKNQVYFLIYFVLTGILVFYLQGSGFLLVFSASAILWILKQSGSIKRLNLVYVILITYLILWISGSYIFKIPEGNPYFDFAIRLNDSTQFKLNIIFYLYVFYIPLLFGIILLIQYLGIEHINKKWTTVLNYSLLVILTFVGVISHNRSFNKETKNIVASDYYSYHNNPERTAEAAMSLENYSFSANINYNLAILKSGKLSEDFFDFFQISGVNVLYPDNQNFAGMSLLATDFYYELGDILEAKYWALESLKQYPYNRRLLQKLVKIELITGNYNDAKKYLNVLDLEFFNRDFIKKYEPYCKDSALIQSDQEIMQKRSYIPNFIELPETPLLRFQGLLEANPKNKVAYECMMLYYMLIGDLEHFVENYRQVGNYFTGRVNVYEEAILMYGATNSIPVADDYKISEANINRLKLFADELKNNGDNDRQAMNEMYAEFGKSYFYYYYFVLPQIFMPEFAGE